MHSFCGAHQSQPFRLTWLGQAGGGAQAVQVPSPHQLPLTQSLSTTHGPPMGERIGAPAEPPVMPAAAPPAPGLPALLGAIPEAPLTS
jgi:hypothetical protein